MRRRELVHRFSLDLGFSLNIFFLRLRLSISIPSSDLLGLLIPPPSIDDSADKLGSRKRAESTSSYSSPPPSGPTTRSKRAHISSSSSSPSSVSAVAAAPSSSTRSRASRFSAAAASSDPMDTSTESSGFRRGGRGNKGNDNSNNNSNKGKEKEHDVRVRERERAREQLNLEVAAASGLKVVKKMMIMTMKMLRLLVDDLLPSSGIGSASSSHLNGRMKKILAGLRSEGEEGKQVEALTQLCEMLSIGTKDSLSTFSDDSFVLVLVSQLNHESNPDIILLAATTLTHLCDVLPCSSCAAVIHYGAVSCFVARLLTIEYMDLAEQSLQALKKISQEHPTACLRAGALMAVLSYLDFFSTGVHVASFPDKMDELCNHGLVTQDASLISTSNSGGGQASTGVNPITFYLCERVTFWIQDATSSRFQTTVSLKIT
ncbi:unnamed protein product [Cochlearia groenlandica]